MSIESQQISRPVSKRTLELILSNGDEFVDQVARQIREHKLPYEIVVSEDGKYSLRDTLNRGQLALSKFITVDKDTIELKDRAIKAANTPHEVLIVGPTGTGKEIVARSQIFNRQGGFRAINCAGIPETLIESILFGHVKGSFTGATTDRTGFIAEAQDGVMFMDEIGEMPLQMQAKLLRTIQEKRINKVGSTVEQDISCKFVFATNKDLEKMVREKTFREDLYARISMLELHIKPLADRLCDAIPIAKAQPNSQKFLENYSVALEDGTLNLDHNVRSIQKYIVRYNVFGSIS